MTYLYNTLISIPEYNICENGEYEWVVHCIMLYRLNFLMTYHYHGEIQIKQLF